jgi:hypothetical protein
MRTLRCAAFALGALSLAACAGLTYENTTPGTLQGQLIVMWVGEDRFVYASYEDDPLVFTPSSELQVKLGIRSFRPGLMYTDGGSIPRPLRALEGFSPWGYGPAYIVHDWLFAAHACLLQHQPDMGEPRDRTEYMKVNAVSFEDSAVLLAEIIKTLMLDNRVQTNPFAFSAISSGVDSFVARDIWNSSDPNSCKMVSQKDRQDIMDAFHKAKISGRSLFTIPFNKGAARPKPPVAVFQQTYGR